MPDDVTTGALDTAIEEAHQLNQQTIAVLQKAIEAATGRGFEAAFLNDYQFNPAVQMLKACLRANNVTARYFLTRLKKQRAQAKRK